MDYQPWIEKYRPKQFEDIVLSKHNKILLDNIITSTGKMLFDRDLNNLLF